MSLTRTLTEDNDEGLVLLELAFRGCRWLQRQLGRGGGGEETDILVMHFSKAFDKACHLCWSTSRGITESWARSTIESLACWLAVGKVSLLIAPPVAYSCWLWRPLGDRLRDRLVHAIHLDLHDNLPSTVRIFAADTMCHKDFDSSAWRSPPTGPWEVIVLGTFLHFDLPPWQMTDPSCLQKARPQARNCILHDRTLCSPEEAKYLVLAVRKTSDGTDIFPV